jgi:hypothetical protein
LPGLGFIQIGLEGITFLELFRGLQKIDSSLMFEDEYDGKVAD